MDVVIWVHSSRKHCVKAIHSLTGDSQRAIDFADCSSHKLKKVKLVGWAYPPMERMKLSVDGCSKGNPGVAGAGGLIRDSLGSWIKGFAVSSTGLCTSVKAELWAVVTGLELAWPMVLRRLILEMDSDNFFPLV